jgi:hypothetical protein
MFHYCFSRNIINVFNRGVCNIFSKDFVLGIVCSLISIIVIV